MNDEFLSHLDKIVNSGLLRVIKPELYPDTVAQIVKCCMLHCVALYRSLHGSAEPEGKPQTFPEPLSSTDPDGTAAFTGS